jgi:NACalpha-BTF3-like transcription factor
MPSTALVEGHVAQLTAMGFSRAAALEALRACKYDVTAAADRLLR